MQHYCIYTSTAQPHRVPMAHIVPRSICISMQEYHDTLVLQQYKQFAFIQHTNPHISSSLALYQRSCTGVVFMRRSNAACVVKENNSRPNFVDFYGSLTLSQACTGCNRSFGPFIGLVVVEARTGLNAVLEKVGKRPRKSAPPRSE